MRELKSLSNDLTSALRVAWHFTHSAPPPRRAGHSRQPHPGGCARSHGRATHFSGRWRSCLKAAAMASGEMKRTKSWQTSEEHQMERGGASEHPKWRPHPKGQDLPTTATFTTKQALALVEQQGSRMVGGKRPHDETAYNAMESVQYLRPDTKREEYYFQKMGPAARRGRRLFMWLLYAAIGIAVALTILYTLVVVEYIQKKRSYWTKNVLKKGDLGGAWLVWTGSSLALCTVACLCVSAGRPSTPLVSIISMAG
jgi:hypothetical protein